MHVHQALGSVQGLMSRKSMNAVVRHNEIRRLTSACLCDIGLNKLTVSEFVRETLSVKRRRKEC